jgi:hypothetical protein
MKTGIVLLLAAIAYSAGCASETPRYQLGADTWAVPNPQRPIASAPIDLDALERELNSPPAPPVAAPPRAWTQEELLAMALAEQNREMAALRRQMAGVQQSLSRQPQPYSVPRPRDDGQEQLHRWNQDWHQFQEDVERGQRHNDEVNRQGQMRREALRRQQQETIDSYGTPRSRRQ